MGLGDQLGLQQGQHGPITAAPAALVAPAQPQRRSGLGRQSRPDPAVGVGTHRIVGPAQQRRRGRDPRKQVEHLQGAIAPAAGEAQQPPQGGVVADAIGPGGIETDEDQPWPLRRPLPLEPPAVAAAGAEGGRTRDLSDPRQSS